MRKNHAHHEGEGSAQRGSEIQRRGEDAAGGAASETDRRGQHLQRKQQCEQACIGHLVVEGRLDDAIADAIDIGMTEGVSKNDHHQADHGHADDILGIGISRQLGKAVLHNHEQANKGPGGDAAQDSQHDKGDRLLQTERLGQGNLNVRDDEGRIGSDQDPADGRRGAGCNDDGKKGAVRDLGQQDFQREEHAAKRRVESRCDPGAGARREQGDLLPRRELDRLGESRTQRRADLNDRPLAADRRPTADRKCRGQRFYDRNLAADIAALVKDRVHHLGNAMALGLRGETLHQKDDDEAAEDRAREIPSRQTGSALR